MTSAPLEGDSFWGRYFRGRFQFNNFPSNISIFFCCIPSLQLITFSVKSMSKLVENVSHDEVKNWPWQFGTVFQHYACDGLLALYEKKLLLRDQMRKVLREGRRPDEVIPPMMGKAGSANKKNPPCCFEEFPQSQPKALSYRITVAWPPTVFSVPTKSMRMTVLGDI